MNVHEASAISGFAPFTLKMFARKNEFAASKPRGNRGGWDICEESFSRWMKRRRINGANLAMREEIKRGGATV